MASAMAAGSAPSRPCPPGVSFMNSSIHRTHHRVLGGGIPGDQTGQADQCVAGHRATSEQLGRSGGPGPPLGEQFGHRHSARPVEDDTQSSMITVVENQHHPAEEVGISQPGDGDQQVAGQLIRGGTPP